MLKKLEIYINWWLSLKHGFDGLHDFNRFVGFTGFLSWFGLASIHSSI